MIQGLDINHREVFVKADAKAGESFRMDLQSYTGTIHKEFHLIVELGEHDRKLRKAYYDIAVPMYGLNRMKEDDKVRLDLETALTDTINLLDLRVPYSKEFYASVEAAEAHIQEAIYEKMGGYEEVIATCNGHTHIDVAWLWTVDQVRQKSCRSFATVLKFMEEYPDYHFMSSQPKLYSFVKERHPEMYQRIKERVKEGRWEPEGGMWVEADCNLTSGESLVRFGYGDGGGGPTRDMMEMSGRMDKGIKGIPKVRQAFAGQYFDELWERVKDNKRLPEWVGELYFEYHRGTYTSMARNKRSNRKSEYAMMELELLSVLAEMTGKEAPAYPKSELDRMWELILTNQFHDILPGSSIKEVYDQTKKEYADIEKTSGELIDERLASLTDEKEEAITVWNTLGHERNDLVELPAFNGSALTDGADVYPVQKTADGAVAYVKGIPSKGYVVLRSAEAAPEKETFRIDERPEGGFCLETPFYEIIINDQGEFTSLFDKENDRQVLQDGKAGNELRIYEDKPLCYSNWNTDIFHQEKSWRVENVRSMEWLENGPVRATLQVERELMGTVIRQKIHFYGEDRRIDFETYVDWKFSEHLLKVHFPVDVHTDEATYDIQFGNLTRKIHENTSWDLAKFEVCGHKWVDLSEGDYGVSLMNDCKYGFSMKHRVMTQTLIKSGTDPNPHTDQEEHFFTYSLYPHKGTWKTGGTVREALNLNVKARAVKGAAEKENWSFLSVDKENVILETVKKAEDGNGIIVRLYEVNNSRTSVTLASDGTLSEARETDLLENPVEERKLEMTDHTVSFTIKPYEILTLRLQMKGSQE